MMVGNRHGQAVDKSRARSKRREGPATNAKRTPNGWLNLQAAVPCHSFPWTGCAAVLTMSGRYIRFTP